VVSGHPALAHAFASGGILVQQGRTELSSGTEAACCCAEADLENREHGRRRPKISRFRLAKLWAKKSPQPCGAGLNPILLEEIGGDRCNFTALHQMPPIYLSNIRYHQFVFLLLSVRIFVINCSD
jgi:hypothetical protein